MRRHTPPTAALQAFEACARHLSVSRAAEELHLTQSAVSRQLAGLEALLGVRLFLRVRQRLVMTAAAAAYAPQLRAALARIEAATLEVMAHQGAGGTLTLAVQPTFGTRWLMPRLPRFLAAHRRIVVNFRNYTTRPMPLDFAAEDVDAAIMLEETPQRGIATHRLVADRRVPVCAPVLAETLAVTADIARQTLLQHSTRPRAWADWLAMAGVEGVDGFRGPRFHHHAMVAEAAAQGMGVALMPRFMVAEDIARGRLAVPFDQALDSGEHYVFAYPETSAELPALRLFRDWLIAEAQE
ncbi:LysR family transcriptional regulator [Roseomonas sp. HJA6]|uniref:LysR family transcriptional regulator n=1 Tax=Roseomonas alba TaxID=2846776 RepID=A0ABS7A8S6_9PROT|nr:LysR substrate-binding domain-containing protein [Neoroseomonas alba]MBW6398490.1 LysR family transcriptional regulator [Neoroseomonas alba]